MPTTPARALTGHLVTTDRGSRLVMDRSGAREAGAPVRFTEGDLFRLIEVVRLAGFAVEAVDYHTDGDTFELLGNLDARVEQLAQDRDAEQLADLFSEHGIHLSGVKVSRAGADALVKLDGVIAGTSDEFLESVVPVWWERTRHLPVRQLVKVGRLLLLSPWGTPRTSRQVPVRLSVTDLLKLAARARSYGYTGITLRTTSRSEFPVDAELNRLVRNGLLRKARRFLSAHGAHLVGVDLIDLFGERTEIAASGDVSSHGGSAYLDLLLPWWQKERRTPLRSFERTPS